MSKNNSIVNWVLGIALVALLVIHFAFPRVSTERSEKDQALIDQLNDQMSTMAKELATAKAEAEKPVIVQVADTPSAKDLALAEVQKRFGEEDKWLTCDDVLYDDSDVSFKVLSWKPEYGRASDKHSVFLDLRVSYIDDSDNHPCKQDLDFEVRYEDGEKTRVILVD